MRSPRTEPRAAWTAAALSLSVAFGCATLLLAPQGCSDEASSPTQEDAGPDAPAGPTTEILHPDAPPLTGETECTVTMVTGIQNPAATHVPICTPVEYATNPPSGGDHWDRWAQYKEYDLPVPREMYVHNQEHGAVVFSYHCPAGCPEVVTVLRRVRDELPEDPICVPMMLSTRTLLAPDPDLPAPIAVSAWGATYVATCLHEESLSAFARKVYGKGTEKTCAPGLAIDGADAGPSCNGAGGGGAGGGGDAGRDGGSGGSM